MGGRVFCLGSTNCHDLIKIGPDVTKSLREFLKSREGNWKQCNHKEIDHYINRLLRNLTWLRGYFFGMKITNCQSCHYSSSRFPSWDFKHSFHLDSCLNWGAWDNVFKADWFARAIAAAAEDNTTAGYKRVGHLGNKIDNLPKNGNWGWLRQLFLKTRFWFSTITLNLTITNVDLMQSFLT